MHWTFLLAVLVASQLLVLVSSASVPGAYRSLQPRSTSASGAGGGDMIEVLRRGGGSGVTMDSEEGIQDALKYLDELDKYYGQVGRPRFGKRSRSTGPSRRSIP